MPAIVIIPARYASTRFPGKSLAPLLGKPMIQHVYERSKKARLVKEIYVATDSREIYKTIEGFGGKAIMTSQECKSGTDRIAEAVEKIQTMDLGLQPTDIVVNVQGDEPAIRPEMIDFVIGIMDDKRASIGTLVKRIEKIEEIFDPNIVKAVFDREGFALYFSRAPIPYHRDLFRTEVQEHRSKNLRKFQGIEISDLQISNLLMFKHIGIYAYRKDVLLNLSKIPPTRLEEKEKLEQLRAMEYGFKIKVKETEFDTIGVDTPADLERAAKMLASEERGEIDA